MTNEQSVVKLDGTSNYEVFDYPGEYLVKGDGSAYTKARMEEDEVPHDVVHGGGTCRSFCIGGKFKIDNHRANSERGGNYVITSISHAASEPGAYETGTAVGGDYSNSFRCIPISVVFRPERITPKPVIQGAQPAVVVGPDGEEVWTDEYGRVQVQFFWDRQSQRKQDTSCWIRCMQTSAGKGWGSMFIPRIGQEVIVTYVDGDPDRPLITGLVYNADQMPAYELPNEKTKSYIKTNSTLGGDGYNEIRFEDKKDKEQIFIHAQRNMDTRVRSNCMERVIGSRHLITGSEDDGKKAGDQKEMVYQDKHLTVHRNQIEHIGGDMQLLVGGIEGDGNQDIVIKKDKKELIEGDHHHLVKGQRSEQVDGDQSLTVGGNQQEKVGTKHALDAGQEIHLKAGMKVVLEAGVQLTIKAAGGFVDIGPSGVTIQGILVNINSGGAAGAGSGSSPASPQDAKEAAPDEPKPADNSKTGQKSTPY
jgi:type VI secretion system secreted protein VgrG